MRRSFVLGSLLVAVLLGGAAGTRAAAQVPAAAASLVPAAAVGSTQAAATAASRPESGAAEVAQRYMVALLSGRWDQAAAQLDAAELELLRAALRESSLPGVGSTEALDALPPVQVFVRLMRSVDARSPERFAGIAGARVVEAEPQGPEVVQVRIELLVETESGSRRELRTLVARRSRDDWRLQLPAEIAELVQVRSR
jgi:hypothetical protein